MSNGVTYNDYTASGEGSKTLIIREGKAPDVEPPAPAYQFAGLMSAPFDWINTRASLIDVKNAVLEIDLNGKTLTFREDRLNNHTPVITGKATLSKEIERFQFGRKHSQKELVEIVRKNRHLFESQEEAQEIQSAIHKITVTASKVISSEEKDQGGNHARSVRQTVDTAGIPTSFNLSTPIYTGGPVRTYNVEIWIDVRDAGVSFELDSIELERLKETELEATFNAEIEKIQVVIADLTILKK